MARQCGYYVVNVEGRRFGSVTTGTHIMRSDSPAIPGAVWSAIAGFTGVGSNGKQTLCGKWAARYVDVFEPREASCRECKKRWQVATGAQR